MYIRCIPVKHIILSLLFHCIQLISLLHVLLLSKESALFTRHNMFQMICVWRFHSTLRDHNLLVLHTLFAKKLKTWYMQLLKLHYSLLTKVPVPPQFQTVDLHQIVNYMVNRTIHAKWSAVTFLSYLDSHKFNSPKLSLIKTFSALTHTFPFV